MASKFKVGDRVKIVNPGPSEYYQCDDVKNKIATIKKVEDDCLLPYRLDYTQAYWSDSELELVEESKSSPKFKVGDRVKLLKSKTKYSADECFYAPAMDEFEGTETIIERMVYTDCFNVKGNDWSWSSEWMELVEESKPQTKTSIGIDWGESIIVQEGSETIFYTTDDIIKPIKKQTTMSKITTFVKNLTLSADEKLLRKHSLKNDCGDYTDQAREAVIEKLVADNNDYLVKIAQGLEAEAEKNK